MAEVERALGAVDVLANSAGAAKRYAPEELDEKRSYSVRLEVLFLKKT